MIPPSSASRRLWSLAALALVTTMLAACGSARRGAPLTEPLELATESLERGRKAYDRHCFPCHGNGEGAMGPGLNDKPLPQFLVRMQTRLGLGAMPSFSDRELSDGEVRDIAAYVVALRKHGR